MRENQFSIIEKMGFNLLKRMPFKNQILKNINKIRLNKIKNLKTPTNLVYYITNNCNSRCKHCFYWKNLNKSKNELNQEQIKKIAQSLKHPLDMLSITGGEPYMRKDITQICNIFYKYNKTKRINIATNGFLTDFIVKSTKQILKQNPKKRLTIFISLDGLEKTHDFMRGVKGAFKKAIETIIKLKKIKNKNLSLFAATTICNQNYKELPKLIKFVKKLKIIHKFNILRDNSTVYNIDKKILHDFNPQSSILPKLNYLEICHNQIKKNAKTLSSKIEALKIRYSIDMLKTEKPTLNCLARFTNAVLFPEGEVSVCEPTKAFGNLKETNYNFERLWNLQKAKQMKAKLTNCFCLQSCNLLNSMKYDAKTIQRLLK